MPPRTRSATDRSTPTNDDRDSTPTVGQLDTTRHSGEAPTPRAAGTNGITIRLPLPTLGAVDAKRLLWYGGLGALATIGILDWPVALVVGTGTIIAGRASRTPSKN